MVMSSKYGVSAENIRDAAYGVTIPPGNTVDTKIERLIEKAELKLPSACISKRMAAGVLDQETVASVVEDMVVRVVKNPRGYRQRSIDDFQATIDTALSSGRLYLAPDERDLLCPPQRPGRVGSIRMKIPAWRLPGVRRC